VRTLEQLDASGDINSRGLELLARLYQKLGRGERLSALAPRLRNAKELPEQQVNELLAHAQLEELRVIGERGERAALEQAWDALPRAVRRLPQAVVAYARGLMASKDHPAAEKVLREAIDETPDTAAIRLLRRARAGRSAAAARARRDLVAREARGPDLLLTCARLCLRAELFGKARSYLEASLARRPNPEASLLLADLLESIDEPARSSAVLRDAVTRTAGRRIPLPRTRLRRS
jgi:HemY protein